MHLSILTFYYACIRPREREMKRKGRKVSLILVSGLFACAGERGRGTVSPT